MSHEGLSRGEMLPVSWGGSVHERPQQSDRFPPRGQAESSKRTS